MTGTWLFAKPPAEDAPAATFGDNTQELTDYIKAYQDAAAEGMPYAQYNLGAAYRWGIGVPLDLAQAVIWIRRAAENGYAPAQRVLGNLYEKGEGITVDEKEALLWYRRASKQGDKQAQDDLDRLIKKIGRM